MIIDKIMDFFNKEDRLMVKDGGQKFDLFGPGNEDAFKIGDDFDVIIKTLLNDEQGKKIYADLVESGNIDQLKDLWIMGGSPSLEYTDEAKRLARPKQPADYGAPFFSDVEAWTSEKGSIRIYGGYETDSYDKFNLWIAELAHGIGYHNPSMMKLPQEEFRDEAGNLLGVNPMVPTLEFLKSLDQFPEPQSPADSVRSYYNWMDSLPPDIPHFGRHEVKGSPENITHAQIESATHWWLEENLGIPFRDKRSWGYEEE